MFHLPEVIRSRLPIKKTKEQLDEHYRNVEEMPLEKNDFLAMVIAAFITFMPVLLIAMAVLYGLMWLFIL